MNEAMYLDPEDPGQHRPPQGPRAPNSSKPEKGYLACGDTGWGRLAEPEAVVKEGLRILGPRGEPQGEDRPGHGRADPRTPRPCPFPLQPLVGEDGLRARPRGDRPRREDDPRLRSDRARPAGRRANGDGRDGGRDGEGLPEGVPQGGHRRHGRRGLRFPVQGHTGRKAAKDEIGPSLAIEKTTDILALLGRKKKPGQLLVGLRRGDPRRRGPRPARRWPPRRPTSWSPTPSAGARASGPTTNAVRIIAPSGPVQETGLLSKREVSRVIFDRIEAAA